MSLPWWTWSRLDQGSIQEQLAQAEMYESMPRVSNRRCWDILTMVSCCQDIPSLKRRVTAIPLLGIYPEKIIIQKDTCTTMFIAALFTIARTWKQPKCPSTDEWIKKMWHIYTMEYYSAIKRNEIELFVMRWMDLESVIQSAVSQKEKNKYRMLTHIYRI